MDLVPFRRRLSAKLIRPSLLLLAVCAFSAPVAARDFSYRLSGTPGVTSMQKGGGIGFTFPDPGTASATASAVSLPAILWTAHWDALYESSQGFNAPFLFELELTDTPSQAKGTLAFGGIVNGTVARYQSEIGVYPDLPTTRDLLLRDARYTVSIASEAKDLGTYPNGTVTFSVACSAAPYAIEDIRRACSLAAGLTPATPEDPLRLDLDASGSIEMADALTLARAVLR